MKWIQLVAFVMGVLLLAVIGATIGMVFGIVGFPVLAITFLRSGCNRDGINNGPLTERDEI